MIVVTVTYDIILNSNPKFLIIIIIIINRVHYL